MDHSATSWLYSELGMDEDQSFNNGQCDIMDFFDESISAILEDGFQNYHQSTNYGNSSFSTLLIPNTLSALSAMEPPPVPLIHFERPAKQHMYKNNSYNSYSNLQNIPNYVLDQPAAAASSSPILQPFGNPNMPAEINPQQVNLGALNPEDDAALSSEVILTSHGSFTNLDETTKTVQTKTKKTSSRLRPPSQTYDHIIAERKRREQLSQRFVALSAIVPGLKKMDKTSVLGDAIKYLKHLQERVKILEEQAAKQTMESVVLVRKSQVILEDEGSSDEMSGSTTDEQPLPEFQAKLCNKCVLLRVHCENRKGVLVKIISEVEKLKLFVTNVSVAPFGNLALDITIIAEMEKEFDVTIKELIEILRCALQKVKQDA